MNVLPHGWNEADLRTLLEGLHAKMSWRGIAALPAFKEIGIPFGTLCTIASGGIVPKRWLRKLNLPYELPAPVCPIHNIVEQYDCRTQVVRAKPKPKQKKQRDRYPRYYAWLFESIPAKEWK